MMHFLGLVEAKADRKSIVSAGQKLATLIKTSYASVSRYPSSHSSFISHAKSPHESEDNNRFAELEKIIIRSQRDETSMMSHRTEKQSPLLRPSTMRSNQKEY